MVVRTANPTERRSAAEQAVIAERLRKEALADAKAKLEAEIAGNTAPRAVGAPSRDITLDQAANEVTAGAEAERVAKLPAEQLTPEQLKQREKQLGTPLIPSLLGPKSPGEKAAARDAGAKDLVAGKEIISRRKPLRFRGRKSTRSGITLDAFASSLSDQKMLKGR